MCKGWTKDHRQEIESLVWEMPSFYHRVWQSYKGIYFITINFENYGRTIATIKRIPLRYIHFMERPPGVRNIYKITHIVKKAEEELIMKKFTIITSLVLLVCMIFSFTLAWTANAAEPKAKGFSEIPIEGTKSPYKDRGYDYNVNSSVSNDNSIVQSIVTPDIVSYNCEIVKVSNGYIRGFAQTNSNTNVDEIGYTLYFQMWDGYKWATLDSRTNSCNDACTIQNYHYKTVSIGKYYRVSVDHYIIYNGIKETATSISTYIYI